MLLASLKANLLQFLLLLKREIVNQCLKTKDFMNAYTFPQNVFFSSRILENTSAFKILNLCSSSYTVYFGIICLLAKKKTTHTNEYVH